MSMNIQDKLLGSIYGHLIGDAFGVPYEFIRPEKLPEQIKWRGGGVWKQPVGTWSDDGAMMLCMLASLTEKKKFDPDDISPRFVQWYDHGYMAAGKHCFDTGNTTRIAISRIRSGVPPLEAAPFSEKDNGNGSLMRILPLALWSYSMPIEDAIALMHDGSRLTHGHVRSQVCCAVYGLLIRNILNGKYYPIWDEAISLANQAYLDDRDDRFEKQYGEELGKIIDFSDCKGSGYVVDCLCSAWNAVKDADDYVDAVTRAVKFGRDTDTTAAVAGGLAGLVFGVESIPIDWRNQLRLESEQCLLIQRFVDIISSS